MNKTKSSQLTQTGTDKRSFVAGLITRARSLQKADYEIAAIVIAGLALAIMLRYNLLDFKTVDFYKSFKQWYDIIKSLGFHAFAINFYDYNPPYLYLLYLISRFLPDTPTVIAIKMPSLFADFISAYFVYRIVQIKYPNGLMPVLAGLTLLFVPTVVLNSAFWGQADSLFTAGILAFLFFFLTHKHGWAMLSFGIALAFKLQAVFLAPLLLALLLQKSIHWKYFMTVPAILVLALLPAWIAGRPIQDLMNIYLHQASEYESLTMNAPSLYAWLPPTTSVFNLFYTPGVIAGAISAYSLFLIIYKSPRKLVGDSMIALTLLVLLVIPFFLPKMHERYFYPADVISIIFAFYYPQFYYIPVLIGAASFFAYQPYLFTVQQIPLPILTAVLLLSICVLTYHALTLLYSPETQNDLPPSIEPSIDQNEPSAAGSA